MSNSPLMNMMLPASASPDLSGSSVNRNNLSSAENQASDDITPKKVDDNAESSFVGTMESVQNDSVSSQGRPETEKKNLLTTDSIIEEENTIEVQFEVKPLVSELEESHINMIDSVHAAEQGMIADNTLQVSLDTRITPLNQLESLPKPLTEVSINSADNELSPLAAMSMTLGPRQTKSVSPLVEGTEGNINTKLATTPVTGAIEHVAPELSTAIKIHGKGIVSGLADSSTEKVSTIPSAQVPKAEVSAKSGVASVAVASEPVLQHIAPSASALSGNRTQMHPLDGVNTEFLGQLKDMGKGEALAVDKLVSSEVALETLKSTSALSQLNVGLKEMASGRVQIPINISFGQAPWASMVAERTAMIVSQNIQFAELQLDPPELGPLQVRVSVQNDQAVVSFSASNGQVREALDFSLTRLKELLEQQGLNLADVDVSDQSQQQEESQQQEMREAADSSPVDQIDNEQATSQVVHVPMGIDHYA